MLQLVGPFVDDQRENPFRNRGPSNLVAFLVVSLFLGYLKKDTRISLGMFCSQEVLGHFDLGAREAFRRDRLGVEGLAGWAVVAILGTRRSRNAFKWFRDACYSWWSPLKAKCCGTRQFISSQDTCRDKCMLLVFEFGPWPQRV